MRLHQVLTGSCNSNPRTFAKGQVEETIFVAYASGCDLVLLDARFRRVQIIPGVTQGQVQISGVDCSLDSGRIAASYGNRVCVFQPLKNVVSEEAVESCVAAKQSDGGMECTATNNAVGRCAYKWVCCGELVTDMPIVNDIAWSPAGERLLSAGKALQVWQRDQQKNVRFGLYDVADCETSSWTCVWHKKMGTPVSSVAFSPDGLFFATLGIGDTLLRVWYELISSIPHHATKKQQHQPRLSIDFDNVIISHPAEITSFQWRQTSRFMPPGGVANVLLTACTDNISRIWIETLLPEDGLVDMLRVDPQGAKNPQRTTLRYRRHLLARVLSYSTANGRINNVVIPDSYDSSATASVFPITQSVHNFHGYSLAHDFGVEPMLRFSLVITINPETDIPLLPTGSTTMATETSGSEGGGFVVHFLNNKQLHFNLQAERALAAFHASSSQTSASSDEMLDAQVTSCLREWHSSADMLFAVHPIDGSFLVWMVEWFDEVAAGSQRQAQLSFSSRIPAAFPQGDAQSMCPHLVIYGQHGETFCRRSASLDSISSAAAADPLDSSSPRGGANTPSSLTKRIANKQFNFALPCARIISKHCNGSLNLWQVNFSETSNFQTVISIEHINRMSGHRFSTNNIACHPVLPLLLTTSHHNCSSGRSLATSNLPTSELTLSSELILWRVDAVGPLHCGGGGLTELARINKSNKPAAFRQVAWLPLLLPASSLGLRSSSQSAFFIADDGVQLRFYVVIIDGRAVLAAPPARASSLLPNGDISSASLNSLDATSLSSPQHSSAISSVSDLVSLQSTGRPGCILELAAVVQSRNFDSKAELLLLHVFAASLMTGCHRSEEQEAANTSTSAAAEDFFLVQMQSKSDGVWLTTWKLVIGNGKCTRDDPNLLLVDSTLVSSQRLSLPLGVSVTCATMCAGHLSSASIYPACYAPYLIATACSDSRVRFWKRGVADSWTEWTMFLENCSAVQLEDGCRALSLSCAYSGRMAVAFRRQASDIKVAVFEHESSGGCEWLLEDTIRLDVDSDVDRDEEKHPHPIVQLDWVGTEDGGHILSVSVGTQIHIYAAVSAEISSASLREWRISRFANTPQKEVRWMKLRVICLMTADDLLPLATHMAWVREGLLIVGMDNELHVYSQWRDCGGGGVGKAAEVKSSDGVSHQLSEQALAQSAATVHYNRLKSACSGYQLSSGSASTSQASLHNNRLKAVCSSSESQASLAHLDCLHDGGLFEAAQICNPILPQYHPHQLMELLNFGKVKRVKAILAHLTKCIDECVDPQRVRSARRRTSDSLAETAATAVEATNAATLVGLELAADEVGEAEIRAIPPLPIFALLAADSDKGCGASVTSLTTSRGSPLLSPGFGAVEFSETLDAALELDDTFGSDDEAVSSSPISTARRTSTIAAQQNRFYFGPSQAERLALFLSQLHLPGLSRLDQMYLVALANVIANTKTEQSERSTVDAHRSRIVGGGGGGGGGRRHLPRMSTLGEHGSSCGYATTEGSLQGITDSLDDCGLRFFLVMQQHSYLLNTLPRHQRVELSAKGVSPGQFIWAFHSEAERELCAKLPGAERATLLWSDLRQYGAVWWIKNEAHLRQCIENVAKGAFQIRNDPMDAALFFVALRKIKVLHALFKRTDPQAKMTSFLQNFTSDLVTERWILAAKNNAYQLLSKQRFEHAAAFFLLGGDLRGAVEVCVTALNDLQLGLVLARLYGGGGGGMESDLPLNGVNTALRHILHSNVLGLKEPNSLSGSQVVRSLDPFLRSMALWMLKDYDNALATLLDNEENDDASSPNVFNFYNFLRTHPLILRQRRLRCDQGGGGCSNNTNRLLFGALEANAAITINDSNEPISATERQLFFKTAHTYFRMGCPMLALEVLCKIPDYLDMELNESKTPPKLKPDPTSQPGSAAVLKEDNIFALDYQLSSSPEPPVQFGFSESSSDDDDGEEKVTISKSQSGMCAKKRTLDVITHQLRFIACLKIMSDELSTLATGFEVDGGQLRLQLYNWLQCEVRILQSICHYGDDLSPDVGHVMLVKDGGAELSVPRDPLLAETQEFKAKLKRMEQRRAWLRSHQQLFRTLLSYCSLQGASGGGLASMRVELTLLLQELHQDDMKSEHVEFPVQLAASLPLISASVASSKMIIANPVRILQDLKRDVLGNLASYSKPPQQASRELLLLRNLSTALSACVYQTLCDADTLLLAESASAHTCNISEGATGLLFGDSFFMAGVRRLRTKSSSTGSGGGGEYDLHPPASNTPNIEDTEPRPNSECKKWPGVEALRAALARGDNSDHAVAPSLLVLLLESLVAVYFSAIAYSLATADTGFLFRLCAHRFDTHLFAEVFGGGFRQQASSEGDASPNDLIPRSFAGDRLAESRINLYIQSKHGRGRAPTWDKPTSTTERFISPRVSLLNYFLAKPMAASDMISEDWAYDSDSDDDEQEESGEEEDEEENNIDFSAAVSVCSDSSGGGIGRRGLAAPPYGGSKRGRKTLEYLDKNSYSWELLRCAILRFAMHQITNFLPQVGLELTDLPVSAPQLYCTLRRVAAWEEASLTLLQTRFGGVAPPNYLPDTSVHEDESGIDRPRLLRYKNMLEPYNTPFGTRRASRSIRRLWCFLVRREPLQELFIQHIFGTSSGLSVSAVTVAEEVIVNSSVESTTSETKSLHGFIHRDSEPVFALCFNQSNLNCLTLATAKDLLELDVGLSLSTALQPLQITGFDSLRDQPYCNNSSHSGHYDRQVFAPAASGVIAMPFNLYSSAASSAGESVSVRQICRRSTPAIRRLASHPSLPYYLAASAQGVVDLMEWAHKSCIGSVRLQESARINALRFNDQGNRFGVVDQEGKLSLWQLNLVGKAAAAQRPYLSYRCHARAAHDLCWLGSSSLLATCGAAEVLSESGTGGTVLLWDTLLPPSKAVVRRFVDPALEQGAQCLLFAPQHQLLLAGSSRGDLALLDLRQGVVRHTFLAHEAALACMTLDSMEQIVVSGSADGSIKIWQLAAPHELLASFRHEHVGRGGLFRTATSGAEAGVNQVLLRPICAAEPRHQLLFSCGADGSVKWRTLQTMYSPLL